MKGIIRRLRPSPAMVVACIALLFAMTGAGYAAGMLGPNTVGTKQLKKNAVISTKVKNGSLLRADFKSGQIPAGPQGPAGPAGPAGAAGAAGAPGAQGPPGPVHLDYNVTAAIPNPAGTQSSGIATCDTGMYATGGGVSTTGFFSANQEVNMSSPSGNNAWVAYVDNRGAAAQTFRVYVICTDATSITAPAGPALAK
jgi:hypothetical protein